MVKTRGHYNTTIEHYNWYYQQLHKRNEAKRMGMVRAKFSDTKMFVLNKLTNLQREVIELDTEPTDRDMKNINKTFTQLNQAFQELMLLLESED